MGAALLAAGGRECFSDKKRYKHKSTVDISDERSYKFRRRNSGGGVSERPQLGFPLSKTAVHVTLEKYVDYIAGHVYTKATYRGI